MSQPGMARSTRFVVAVGALMLAAGLRLWGLAELPPGLHHDEAFHLLQAQQIADGQALPVYITGNQGNEPLFAYLSAGAILIVGPVSWAGRLVAAVAGLLAVALTIRAGNEMFPGRGVGAAAGVVLAAWYWPLAMSRWGSQPILSAAAAAGAMACLWRGFRSGSRWAFVLAGLCLAAGLWSYAVFRLFPVVMVAAVVAAWVVRRNARRAVAGGAVVAVLVAAAVYSPLGLFFLKNPAWFFNRYSQVAQVGTGAGSLPALWDNTRLELAGLVLPGAGDHDWRQNLAGRPALDLAQLGLMAAGIVWLAQQRSRWPQGVTLAVWFTVGLSVSVLTEFPPQSGRSVMATPAGALVIGAGVAGLWGWAKQRRGARWGPRRLAASAAQGLLVVLLALSVGAAVRDYFVRWANNPALFVAFDTGLAWIGTTLRGAAPETRLIETPVDRFYPTFEYTLGSEPFGRFESFNGRECFLTPGVTAHVTDYAIITAEDSASVTALLSAFPNARQTAAISPGGSPYASVYEVPAGSAARVDIAHPGNALYGGTLRLLGDGLASGVAPAGSTLRVPLVWRLEQATHADLRRFVHVTGPARPDGSTVYAQRDSAACDNSVPTWQWQPGEILIESVRVDLPADVPAGAYQVSTGWYDSGSLQRLPAINANGQALGDSIALGTVQVAAGPP